MPEKESSPSALDTFFIFGMVASWTAAAVVLGFGIFVPGAIIAGVATLFTVAHIVTSVSEENARQAAAIERRITASSSEAGVSPSIETSQNHAANLERERANRAASP